MVLAISKPKNEEVRSREYLTPEEMALLIQAAGEDNRTRHNRRNVLLIRLMFHHGLRVSEAVNLRWSQFDFSTNQFKPNRLKNGDGKKLHPINPEDLQLLQEWRSAHPDEVYLFPAEGKNGQPIGDDVARKLVKKLGELAGLPFPIHPHMLRHATGHYMAKNGYPAHVIQKYLGHRSLASTGWYLDTVDDAFGGMWA